MIVGMKSVSKTSTVLKENYAKLLFAFVVAFSLIIVVRLIKLQIIEHNYYYTLSEKNRVRVVPSHSARGKIYDRNGVLIVRNKPTYTISIIPAEFLPDSEYVRRLSSLIDVPEEVIWQKYEKNKIPGYLPVPIKRRVDFSIVSQVVEHPDKFPGVISQVEPVRDYPLGKFAPHIIGYVGEISAPELRERYKEGLKAGDMVGKQGVERYFDNLLRGRDGAKFIEVSATGEIIGPIRDFRDIPPQNGADLVLTIDAKLQMAAESIFAVAPEGAFIVMDPNNGEILAAVSKPDFDQTIFTKPIAESTWARLNDPVTHPMLCRWYQGLYPPASPMKILAAAAAVDEGIANASSIMPQPCRGAMRYGDRYFFCWNTFGHGYLNMLEAIAQSCDIYFYQIAIKLGLDKWYDYTTKCFFGQPTGIELPFEASGLVPNRDYYNWRFGRRGWGRGVLLNLIIGQGEFLATPLQVAQFFAAIANRGIVWKPKIVKYIEPKLRHRIEIPSVIRGRLPFSQDAINTVIDGMIRTCNEEWATGYGAHMDDILVAGKTGTAQNPHGADHAWFVAFADARQPEILVVVFVESGGSGGSWAFLAREFFDYYFHYWKFENQPQ